VERNLLVRCIVWRQ